MSEATIIGLVTRVTDAAQNIGLVVTRKDVAFIISLFFEGMADTPGTKSVNAWLQSIADEVNNVRSGS
jgi:hypothetical protein